MFTNDEYKINCLSHKSTTNDYFDTNICHQICGFDDAMAILGLITHYQGKTQTLWKSKRART